MYKFLLGTLSREKKGFLKQELERRDREHERFSALEQKIFAAFTANKPTRKYMTELMDDWEKRNWGG